MVHDNFHHFTLKNSELAIMLTDFVSYGTVQISRAISKSVQ